MPGNRTSQGWRLKRHYLRPFNRQQHHPTQMNCAFVSQLFVFRHSVTIATIHMPLVGLYVTSQSTGGRYQMLDGQKYHIWKTRVHLFLWLGSITGLQFEDEWVLRWPHGLCSPSILMEAGLAHLIHLGFGGGGGAGQNLMHSSYWLYKCHYLSWLCGLTLYTWVHAVVFSLSLSLSFFPSLLSLSLSLSQFFFISVSLWLSLAHSLSVSHTHTQRDTFSPFLLLSFCFHQAKRCSPSLKCAQETSSA